MSELSIHVCNRRSSFFRVVRGTPCEPSPCPGTAPELRWGTWCSCFCSFTNGASFSLTRFLDTWWCYQFIDKFVYHQSLFRELYYCYVTYILIISTLFLLLRSCFYLHILLIFCHLTDTTTYRAFRVVHKWFANADCPCLCYKGPWKSKIYRDGQLPWPKK